MQTAKLTGNRNSFRAAVSAEAFREATGLYPQEFKWAGVAPAAEDDLLIVESALSCLLFVHVEGDTRWHPADAHPDRREWSLPSHKRHARKPMLAYDYELDRWIAV